MTVVCLAACALVAGAAAARAADEPPVKIGIIYSYTGATANAGPALDASLGAWLAMHNNSLGGRKVELIRRDDTGPAPDVARRLAQELVVQEHVDFLMGGLYTPNAVAILGVSTTAKVPFFINNAATSGIIDKAPYAVRFGATMQQNTNPLALWAAGRGFKHAYILVSDYAPGIDSSNAFTKAFGATGGTIVGETRVPINAGDFTSYVQRIKDAKPDVLYAFIVNGSPSVAFFKAVALAGLKKAGITLAVSGATVDELDLPALGADAAGAISSAPYAPTHRSAANDAYLRAFRGVAPKGVTVPDFMAEAGFDIMTAIDRVVAAQKGPLDPDKTMELLRGMKIDGPRGPIEIDAQTREMNQNIYIRRTEARRGEFVNVELTAIPMVGPEAKK